MSTELLLRIFNTIVFPHFNYCCPVWGNMKNKESLYKLCKLQKRAARIILNKIFYTTTTEMMQQLRWIPLSDYIENYHSCIQSITWFYSRLFKCFSRYVHEINSRSTRLNQSNSLYIHKAKTEYFKRPFTIYGSNLWNSMPECLNILQLWKLLNLLISIIILTPEIKNVLVLQTFSYMHVYSIYMYPILYIYFSCVLYVSCFLYYTAVCICSQDHNVN
jgi:hypothetical protein